MIRLSMIDYFPYDTYKIGTDEVLTIFINKTSVKDFKIENIASERGLTFSGKNYEIYKDLEKEEEGPRHSGAWYVSQIAKWHKQDLGFLENDINMMKEWLMHNDYIKNGLPTDKFLKQEFLEIADVSEERRHSQ